MLPMVNGACPNIASGPVSVTVNGKAMPWTMWVGAGGGGPVVIYWHGTATNGQEAVSALGAAAIAEVTSQGGVIAAAEVTSGTGANTGDFVWTTGDVDYADQIIACAHEKKMIDPHRIHTAGYSAGGLQAVYMWYARSGYIASVTSYSGGAAFINQGPLQDPSNLAPAIAAHGAAGVDTLVLDFAAQSKTWETDVKAKGGFIIDCNDGSNHLDFAKRFAIAPQVWKFFKDHPFKVGPPEPYTSLPGFPTYCQIVN